VYAEIRAAVEQIRGLKPTAAVDPVTIDEAQLRSNLVSEFDTSYKPADLKNAEDELIALGFLPAGSSLRALTLAFQGGQVAGYYSPEKDQLFVVSRSGGGLGAAGMVTYAHEFTHQLQDQQIHLDTLRLEAHDQGDRSFARLALVEGDATSVQTTWMTDNLTPRQLGEVMGEALDPAALKALQNAPRYLRETSFFPYNDGLTFVSRLIAAGGYPAVDAAFRDPPDSTEQILHPDKYLQREKPIAVVLPTKLAATMGPGWSVAAQDTLGELVLRIWLEQVLSTPDAAAGAAGWGGDRLVLLHGPGGEVDIGLITKWDTVGDTGEFAEAAATTLKTLGLTGEARLAAEDASTTVIVAIGEHAEQVGAALGAGPGAGPGG
jgi:hypothetical protein